MDDVKRAIRRMRLTAMIVVLELEGALAAGRPARWQDALDTIEGAAARAMASVPGPALGGPLSTGEIATRCRCHPRKVASYARRRRIRPAFTAGALRLYSAADARAIARGLGRAA